MLQLKCTGLILTALNGMYEAEGSVDVPVQIEFDSTWDGYTKTLHVGYYDERGLEHNVEVSQENDQFVIPGVVYAQAGIIFISVHFSTAGETYGPETQPVQFFVTKTAGGAGSLPGSYIWEPIVKQYVQDIVDNGEIEFNTDTTLSQEGQAADAKAVGDAISQLNESIDDLKENGVSGGTSVSSNCNCTLKDGDYNVLAINHRGYSSEAPENTIPAYILSKEKGFNYVECDVAFTSDGVAVLLHDSTIDRTSDGSGNISSLTYAEVLQYDFGSWKSTTYTGTKIPTLEEFLKYCKGLGLHPYIELKSSGGYTQEQINGVVDLVEQCGMKGKVSYISFNATFLSYVHQYDSTARIGYLADITTSTIQTALSLKSNNEVFMDVSYGNVTEAKVQMCIDNELPLEIWTVNTESVIQNMNPYITGVTSDNLIAGQVLYNQYLEYVAPSVVTTTSITLDKTTLEFTTMVSQTLIATVEPSDSIEKVVWESDDTNVATVSNGIVTPIANGSCKITATSGSYSATCEVTVDIDESIVTYSITNNLTNVSNDNSNTIVNEEDLYSANLSAKAGYTLGNVVVTMGGTDITSTVYSNGVITITNVTGDVVITASATKNEIEWVNDSITLTSEDLILGKINSNYPYYATHNSRVSYIGTNIDISDGYKYTATFESATVTQFGIQQVVGTLENIENQESIAIIDSGWQSSGYEFTASSIDVSFVWIAFNATSTEAITSVTITRRKLETDEAIYNWDLTSSLTDTVQNFKATTTGTQNENGLTFSSANSYCDFGLVYSLNRTYELEISSLDLQSNGNARLLMYSNSNDTAASGSGLVARYVDGEFSNWHFYHINQGKWDTVTNSELTMNYFAGKKVQIYVDANGYETLYVDGVKMITTAIPLDDSLISQTTHVYMGGNRDDYLYNITVTKFAVYQGNIVEG